MLRSSDIAKLTKHVLGSDYVLSVATVSSAVSHQLNKQYRGKDKPTNVLSFPLSEREGEIILDIETATREAREQARDTSEYLVYLLIHGLLHLKGLRHGSTMEREERQILRFFIDEQEHRGRSRHRHREHPSRGGRAVA